MHQAWERGSFDLLKTDQLGEDNHNAKLTEEKVRAIRAAFNTGAKQAELARLHGIHCGTVHEICRYKSWKHVV